MAKALNFWGNSPNFIPKFLWRGAWKPDLSATGDTLCQSTGKQKAAFHSIFDKISHTEQNQI